MKLKDISWTFKRYEIAKEIREVIWICLHSEKESWAEIAPHPERNQETLTDCLHSLLIHFDALLHIDWQLNNFLKFLKLFNFPPPLSFALESAFFELLDPLNPFKQSTSFLLSGSLEEIKEKTSQFLSFKTLKLKVSALSFSQLEPLLLELKKNHSLRVDVNKGWAKEESLNFFSKFLLTAFEYVEEPFASPHSFEEFRHPLAIDESFSLFSFYTLSRLPSLKAIIYKPSVQGGLLHLLPLLKWAKAHSIKVILGASFETDLGLCHIAKLAKRLRLQEDLGLGTFFYLKKPLLKSSLKGEGSQLFIPSDLIPAEPC